LTIKGRIVDTVEHLGKPMSGILTYAPLSEVAAFLWEGGNLLVKQNIDGEQAVEIMLQTLLCGSLNAKPVAEVEGLRQGFAAVFATVFGHGTFLVNGGESANSPWLPHMRRFLVTGMALAPGRRWCITKTGKFGLVPGGAKKGDRVALFGNYSLPFLLRAHSTQGNASIQSVEKSVQRSTMANLRSKFNNIAAGWLPEPSTNTDTAHTLVGHGYIYELNTIKSPKGKDKDAQEIVLV
jgi:hypothetical protein